MAQPIPNNPAQPKISFQFPTGFIGSDGYMRERFQHATALVGKFGIPDLFITYSCNPRVPEIVNNIKNMQPYQGRPDLIVRSFHMRVKNLIDRVYKKSLLGKVAYYFYAVEFQKRGHPHIHMCLKFSDENKISTIEDVDALISAELSCLEDDPLLFDIVSKLLVHGPCNSNCHWTTNARKNFQSSPVNGVDIH
ncbi:hypothetical protein CDIK_2130 [Cucumispora dikerogammari]|nr:hypothetical protein CDIK_2130 [Cucumispora dikerogammari]